MEVPGRPHDAARQVELDVVDAVLDLLADGFDEAIGTVDLQRVPRGQEMAAVVVRKWPQAKSRGPRCCPESKARFQATSMKE